MRFLRDVKFELDEKGQAALASRIEGFYRGGGMFTMSEWESLTKDEQELAQDIRRALKLEELILERRVMSADSLEAAVDVLRAAGDDRSAAQLLVESAASSVLPGTVR